MRDLYVKSYHACCEYVFREKFVKTTKNAWNLTGLPSALTNFNQMEEVNLRYSALINLI